MVSIILLEYQALPQRNASSHPVNPFAQTLPWPSFLRVDGENPADYIVHFASAAVVGVGPQAAHCRF
jgi:hypothetical protein